MASALFACAVAVMDEEPVPVEAVLPDTLAAFDPLAPAVLVAAEADVSVDADVDVAATVEADDEASAALEPESEPAPPQAASAHAIAAQTRLLYIKVFLSRQPKKMVASSNGAQYQQGIRLERSVAITGQQRIYYFPSNHRGVISLGKNRQIRVARVRLLQRVKQTSHSSDSNCRHRKLKCATDVAR